MGEKEEKDKLHTLIKEACKNGQGDVLRKDVYQTARLGNLSVAHIVLLKIVRNEEAKLHT